MEALHVLDSTPGVSIRGVAKQYNLSEASLRFRRKKIQAGEPDLKKAGRKCAFDGETETFGKMYCRPHRQQCQKFYFNFRKWFKSTSAKIKLRVHVSTITDQDTSR